METRKDVENNQASNVVVGRVELRGPFAAPIIVAARSLEGDRVIAAYTVLHESGEYELILPPGRYSIFAYVDENSNLVYENSEPAGGHPPVRVSPDGVVYDVDIVIESRGELPEVPFGTEISLQKPAKLLSRQAGAITTLDDERFAEKNGGEGFWAPGTFFREFGGNVFFLEKYDPKKIPILFIHGAGGSPRGWRYFIDNLDRSRYQPWVFYYPTGARIDSSSHLLLWKLANLQMKYHFSTFYIVAHSMGGLVARSFLMNSGTLFPGAKLLVTLATPWGGDSMAEYGVAQSPVVVPSWVDMQPEGDFIRSLYRTKLPENVRFYLLYGYRGNLNPLHINNDGTIAMDSLLDYRSQGEAKMIYAFNEDHASIAESKEVMERFNAILQECDGTQDEKSKQAGGYLKVHFTYKYKMDGERPRPILILSPKNKKNTEIVTYLSESDNGKSFGPFPVGEYLANLVTTATAGKPDRHDIPLTIENTSTADLTVSFSADGVLGGCVTSRETRDYAEGGLPDYRYRGEERKIEVQSVRLVGEGVDRMLVPIRGPYISDKRYMIDRTDFGYNECFYFYELPPGKYRITIDSEKFRSLSKEVTIVPGQLTFLQNVELQDNN
jgi:pimeloyl-ACP methyl ester carboxylesterase